MKCQDARRRIGSGDSDRLLIEHLEQCPACARFAEAANVLEKLLFEGRKHEPVIPFETVRDRVNMIANQQSTLEKIMSRIKDQFQTRPRIMAGMGLATAVMLFAVLVPFSFNHTVGYKISLAGLDARAKPSPEVLNAAFAAAGLEDVYVETVTGENDGGAVEDLYIRTPSSEEAKVVAMAISSSLADQYARVDVQPVVMAASRSLLAQLYEKTRAEETPPVRIRFEEGVLLLNGKGVFETLRSSKLSDEEAKDKIIELLQTEKGGDAGVSVDVKTSDDGRTRIIEIQAPAASLTQALSNIKMDASDRFVKIKYNGDGNIPDSVAVVELKAPEKTDSLATRGIKMKILLDLDEEQ